MLSLSHLSRITREVVIEVMVELRICSSGVYNDHHIAYKTLASYPGHVGGGKWPGIHCLRMRDRFRKSLTNESNYVQVTHGCYAEK